MLTNMFAILLFKCFMINHLALILYIEYDTVSYRKNYIMKYEYNINNMCLINIHLNSNMNSLLVRIRSNNLLIHPPVHYDKTHISVHRCLVN